MKKYIILFLFFAFTSTITNAQNLKGSFYIDARFNYSKKNEQLKNSFGNSEESERKLGINPNIGYAIGNRLIVGLGIDFQKKYVDGLSHPNSAVTIKNTFAFKSLEKYLFLKYTTPINKRFFFCLDLNGYHGKSNTEIEDVNLTNGGSSMLKLERKFHGASLSPEILFLITKKVGLQATFNGFNIIRQERVFGGHTTEYTFDLNPSNWKLGVFVLLGKGSVDLRKTETD